ncbi:agamous-like MADS-box protein AGL28 [Coffea eugenioides]|nr:agamous-like MADS-box protein AGL28 [Coffea arabica]XP_027183813.1 agamous-like MADS-box protein AGL28 [Coffea eugenioides]
MKGREKIEMKKIEKEDDLYATFYKLRDELFMEASELCTTCKVDIGVIIFSPTGEPHSFFHPNADKVFNRFLGRDMPRDDADQLAEALARARVEQLEQQLHELEVQQEIEEERAKKLDELFAQDGIVGWPGVPIDQMDMEMVTNLEAKIDNLLLQLEEHAKKLTEEASSSNVPPSKI